MPPYQNNPYNLSYMPQMPQYIPQNNQNQNTQQNQMEDTTIWVEGENAAKSYIMKKNCRIPLWDSTDQKIYIKTTDQNGVPSTVTLKYEIVEPKKLEDIYITKEEFNSVMNNLSSAINDLKGVLSDVKSSVSATKSSTERSK